VVRAATAVQAAPAAAVEARVGIEAAPVGPSRDTGRSDALPVPDGVIQISVAALVVAREFREAKADRADSANGAILTAAGPNPMRAPDLKEASPAARRAASCGADGADGALPVKAAVPAAGTRSSGLPSRGNG